MSDWKYIARDGLPEVDKDVIVYDHGSTYIASFTGRYAQRDYGELPIWDDGEGAVGVLTFMPPPMPTHWMDKPEEPPNEESKGTIVVCKGKIKGTKRKRR